MTFVQVIDTRSNNLSNVLRALTRCQVEYQVITDAAELMAGALVILPGVGAFASCMEKLREHGFPSALNAHLASGGKLLGICVGMQALANSSSEFGHHSGLALVDAHVENLNQTHNVIVPNVNWLPLQIGSGRFEQFNGQCMYFVHSYQMTNFKNPPDCVAIVRYEGIDVTAIIDLGNIIGFQFHPEKSGEEGLALLRYTIALLQQH